MSTQAEVKYDEVDSIGAKYAGLLFESQLQLQEEQQVRDGEEQARAAKSRQLAVQSVEFVLDRMKARAVLLAVRDEVWREGEIVDIEGEKLFGLHNTSSYRAGISLVSDSFPLIMVEGSRDDRSLTLRRDEDRLRLDVIVTLSGENEGITRNTRVSVQDKQSCLITKSEAPNLEELIRREGLDGLYAIQQRRNKRNQFEGLDRSFDPSKPDAYQAFCYSVRKSVDARRGNGSLPGQLRSWSKGLIEQFPSMLKEEGFMDYPPLRALEHRIRGSNRFIVWCEQRMGFSA